MGTTKERNSMDLTEAEDIKKRWQELYRTLKNYTKKYLNDPDKHDGVITPRTRHPGMQTPVGLRNHHSEQS